MQNNNSETIELEAAIDEIARQLRVGRDQARYMLFKALRDGELPAYGINRRTRRREQVPPSHFQIIH